MVIHSFVTYRSTVLRDVRTEGMGPVSRLLVRLKVLRIMKARTQVNPIPVFQVHDAMPECSLAGMRAHSRIKHR